MHQQSEAPQVTNISSSRDNLLGKIDQSQREACSNIVAVLLSSMGVIFDSSSFRLLLTLS